MRYQQLDETGTIPLSVNSRLLVVIFCCVLSAVEGYDVLSAAYAAPLIAREWQIEAGPVGLVLSAGFAGMTLGSFVLAPLGDLFGRRPVILGSLVLLGIAMALTSMASSLSVLIVLRAITGMGVGGMAASLIALTSEYATRRYLPFAIGLIATGFSLGGLLAGLASQLLLGDYGWSSLFILGATMNIVILPFILWFLPESVEFERSKVSRLATQSVAADGVAAAVRHPGRSPIAVLHSSSRRAVIILIPAFFLHFLTFYYLISWAPSFVVKFGYSVAEGASVSSWINTGSIFGGLAMALISARQAGRALAAGLLFLCAISIAAMGLIGADITALKAIGFAGGAFAVTAMLVLDVLLVGAFGPEARATAVGLVMGSGRIGAIAGPIIAGYLMQTGVSNADVILFMAVGSVLAGLIIVGLPKARTSLHPAD